MKTKTTICTTIISDSDEKELIEWDEIVARLSLKFSLVQISVKTGCGDKVLSNLKSGQTLEPKFSNGIQLLALHGREYPLEHNIMFSKSKLKAVS